MIPVFQRRRIHDRCWCPISLTVYALIERLKIIDEAFQFWHHPSIIKYGFCFAAFGGGSWWHLFRICLCFVDWHDTICMILSRILRKLSWAIFPQLGFLSFDENFIFCFYCSKLEIIEEVLFLTNDFSFNEFLSFVWIILFPFPTKVGILLIWLPGFAPLTCLGTREGVRCGASGYCLWYKVWQYIRMIE